MKTYLVWLELGTSSFIDADEIQQDEYWYRFLQEGTVTAQYPRKWITRITEVKNAPHGESRYHTPHRQDTQPLTH